MYRKRLLALVEEMADSYRYWLIASYRQNEPAISQAIDSIRQTWATEYIDVLITKPKRPPLNAADFSYVKETRTRKAWLAMDATPAKELEKALQELAKRWNKRFDKAAEELAAYFAKSASRRSDKALQNILKRGGWTVEFKMTRPMRDILAATVNENVQLIRSIPQEFHTQVAGSVMRSVVAGRDLQQLSNDLEKHYGVTRRRAEFIARDQSNKATGAFQRARYLDLGISRAIWVHSGGGKTQRITHVRNSGKTFDVQKGWYDPAVKQHIWPGFLPNCRCVARPLIRGFS